MKKEYLIWRPNCIPVAQWESMDRRDQIAWWEAEQVRQPKMESPSPERIVEGYLLGFITLSEFQTRVLHSLTEVSLVEFKKKCPVELWEAMAEYVLSLPPDDDDDGWSRIRIIFGGTYPPWIDPEKERQMREESARKFIEQLRCGSRLVRAFGL